MPIILRKWQPNFKSLEFDMEKLSVWVHLNHVPLKMFIEIGLSYIASALRNPLYMDNITSNRQWLDYVKGKLPIVLVLGASSISALGGVALQLQVGYVDVGASTSTSRAVTLEQPHVDFVVARLGPDLVQDSSTALIQIVDSLEQGAEPDFGTTTPVGQEQSMLDSASITQPHVDQVQPIVNPIDQAIVLDCSNQFSTLLESDSRLVREVSKGVAELMNKLKQANKNVPNDKKG
ncbi:hypothetical protein V6N13_122692 [Hibiscus sabdariffa]